MPRKASDVTDAELAVLQVLWEKGTATVRDIVAILYPAGTPSDLATVQKLLKRLENKNCISRNRSTWPHEFQPGIQRDDLISRRLQTTANELCEGSILPLLTQLVQLQTVSAEDRATLREILDDLDKNPRKD